MHGHHLLLLAFALTTAHAQAPIERRPPASAPVTLPNDPAWQTFAHHWNRRQGTEFRIEAQGQPLRCHLDFIASDELDCTVYGRPSFFFPLPDTPYRIPRADIREVRTGGRDASTLLGFGIGFGIAAVAVAVNSNETNKTIPILLNGGLLGTLGGYIGHHLPLKGHTLYRAP